MSRKPLCIVAWLASLWLCEAVYVSYEKPRSYADGERCVRFTCHAEHYSTSPSSMLLLNACMQSQSFSHCILSSTLFLSSPIFIVLQSPCLGEQTRIARDTRIDGLHTRSALPSIQRSSPAHCLSKCLAKGCNCHAWRRFL